MIFQGEHEIKLQHWTELDKCKSEFEKDKMDYVHPRMK